MNKASDSTSVHNRSASSPLVKAPTLACMKYVVGQIAPMNRALPSSVETGCSMPENCVVGRMVKIAVTNTAATWLDVNVEITRPMAVVAVTYKAAQRVSERPLPLIGTSNTVTAKNVRMAKLTMPIA